MKFKEIYERILPLWGNNIKFSDAEIINGSVFDEENFYSKKLEKKWDEIQELVGEEDTYADLMVWTMYKIFIKHAAIAANKEINYIKISTIDQKEIEVEYFENLHQESWEEELLNYEREI